MCLFPIARVPKGGKFAESNLWLLGQNEGLAMGCVI